MIIRRGIRCGIDIRNAVCAGYIMRQQHRKSCKEPSIPSTITDVYVRVRA